MSDRYSDATVAIYAHGGSSDPSFTYLALDLESARQERAVFRSASLGLARQLARLQSALRSIHELATWAVMSPQERLTAIFNEGMRAAEDLEDVEREGMKLVGELAARRTEEKRP